MNRIFFIFLVLYHVHKSVGDGFQETLGHVKPKADSDTQAQAVIDLIKRLIPERANEFSVVIDADLGPEGKDTFTIQKDNDTINISGTTGVAAAAGFNYYLKYYCNCHISWETSQLNLPETLPDVNISITLNDRFRYYQNVCTSSYSFVWWDWNQWEKHIDWMALNSFNLVLAFNGQEAIWERVYKRLNLTDEDISEHLSGPAFLAWLRMGNLRGWGGPLPSSWNARSIVLQKSILERMRNLGMIPVLPAFAGHVPRAFERLFPDANMTKDDQWNGFNDTYCCPYFLDPTEDLFKTVGQLFLEEQTAEFGTDHVYNCDSFNEINPATTDLTYLSDVGKSIFSAMTSVDPDAIWLMQGWFFVHDLLFWTRKRAEALLTSVPKGKMIVLDLQSEEIPQYNRLNQYFGQPYIWCMLHNFGGVHGMFGSSEIINKEPIKARNAQNSTMIGVGLTPEGINQNYVIYDLMIENAWRQEPANLSEWFRNYTIRRYGIENENIVKAWQILQRSVYNFTQLERLKERYVVTSTPSLEIRPWAWYNPTDLLEAWDYFISESASLGNNSGFLHDLVDVTRQALQVNGDVFYNELLEAYNNKNVEAFSDVSTIFYRVFIDMERILATSQDFLLGTWIQSAKDCANSSEEEDLYEYNAKNQITLWGPRGEIMNYAIKQWSGVVSNFLWPRWMLFTNYLIDTWDGNFSQNTIKEQMFTLVEEPFTLDHHKYPTEPNGDTVIVAKDIYNRWWLRSKEKYSKYNGAGVVLEKNDDATQPFSKYGRIDEHASYVVEPEVVIL